MDIVLEARQRLSPAVWDYVAHGADSESTVRRNRFAFERYALQPSILSGTDAVDTSSSLMGRRLRMPVVLSPIGSIARFDPRGAAAAAEAARGFGTLHVVASHAAEDIEAEGVGRCALVYALHPREDIVAIDAEIAAVEAAGYVGVSIATQSGFYSRRERDIRSGLVGKGQPASSYADALGRAATGAAADAMRAKAGVSWRLVEHIRSRTRLPLMLKGVQNARDARRALDHGIDVLYVSNNGGRALDPVRGTLEVLPEVVAAAGGRADVILDGGVLRAADIIKALALGAKAVGIGRLQAWALAAGGAAGLIRLLEILEEELVVAMGLMGVARLTDLTAETVVEVSPCMPAHGLASFPIVLEKISARPTGEWI